MRFANAFGTPNFVAPAHVCYAPRVFASGITLGQLPVTDVYGFGGESPACVIVWGCNLTESGAADGMCARLIEHALRTAKEIIVIDPRRTRSAKKATQWLQVRPGTDGALAMAKQIKESRRSRFQSPQSGIRPRPEAAPAILIYGAHSAAEAAVLSVAVGTTILYRT